MKSSFQKLNQANNAHKVFDELWDSAQKGDRIHIKIEDDNGVMTRHQYIFVGDSGRDNIEMAKISNFLDFNNVNSITINNQVISDAMMPFTGNSH